MRKSTWRTHQQKDDRTAYVNFLQRGNTLVCNTDHPNYPDVCNFLCNTCGRSVVCSRDLEFIPVKVCVACATTPNIPDKLTEKVNVRASKSSSYPHLHRIS
jgi:hypothetical protein